MWIAGVMQGLMWRAVNVDGTLTYTFIESVRQLPICDSPRSGTLYLLDGGMAYNVAKTIAAGKWR